MSFESLVLLRLICVCCVIANSSNSWLEGTGQQGKQHLQSSDPDIKKEVFIYLKKNIPWVLFMVFMRMLSVNKHSMPLNVRVDVAIGEPLLEFGTKIKSWSESERCCVLFV